jgi:hypothetical protein
MNRRILMPALLDAGVAPGDPGGIRPRLPRDTRAMRPAQAPEAES